MGILNELESIKYAPVLDLIKRDESFDKKRSVLNGEEVFRLCHNRYQIMQDILAPLKKRLGENIEITDISFVQGMQDSTNILVRYNKNNRSNYFTISNLGFNEIEIIASDDNIEKYGFVLKNKLIILDIFNHIYNDSLDSEFYVHSTSRRFVINDSFKSFSIKDSNAKIFSVERSHVLFDKEKIMYNKEKTMAIYPKLKELLLDENNVLNVFKHLKIYEEDLPKTLIKKTNQ